MVDNFHLPSNKVLFGTTVDDGESNKCDVIQISNNACEVNERHSVFHFHSLNYVGSSMEMTKIRGTYIYIVNDYFVILFFSYKKFTL